MHKNKLQLGLHPLQDLQHLADDCDIDQRTGVGVELLTKPGLFFSDEPISGLDPDTEIVLMQLVPFQSL